MATRSLSVTVSMPIEMDEQIAEEADRLGMSYSKYVRGVLRAHTSTPFEQTEEADLIVNDEDAENAQTGAA